MAQPARTRKVAAHMGAGPGPGPGTGTGIGIGNGAGGAAAGALGAAVAALYTATLPPALPGGDAGNVPGRDPPVAAGAWRGAEGGWRALKDRDIPVIPWGIPVTPLGRCHPTGARASVSPV